MTTVEELMDPYEFSEPDYDHRANNFNDSFIYELFADSDNESFEGFDTDDCHFGPSSKVVSFHHRRDDQR